MPVIAASPAGLALLSTPSLHARIIIAARRWYRSGGNAEAELAAAVRELEDAERQHNAAPDSDAHQSSQSGTSEQYDEGARSGVVE